MTSIFASLASAVANTAWRNSGWALTHLQPYAGKTLRVELIPPLGALPLSTFAMRVTADGNWETVASENPDSEAAADATLRMTSTVGARLAQLPDKPGGALDITGDAGFVAALRDLHDVLPIAIEDRISSVVGPIAAHAALSTLRSIARWPQTVAERLNASTVAWIVEEQRMLVGRGSFERFAKDVEALSERTAHLLEKHRL